MGFGGAVRVGGRWMSLGGRGTSTAQCVIAARVCAVGRVGRVSLRRVRWMLSTRPRRMFTTWPWRVFTTWPGRMLAAWTWVWSTWPSWVLSAGSLRTSRIFTTWAWVRQPRRRAHWRRWARAHGVVSGHVGGVSIALCEVCRDNRRAERNSERNERLVLHDED